MVAQAMGHKPGAKYKYSAPPVFLFEPHQPEQCNYKPRPDPQDRRGLGDRSTRRSRSSPRRNISGRYYERVALNRGIQGSRNTGVPMTYGEAYQRLFPTVAEELA